MKPTPAELDQKLMKAMAELLLLVTDEMKEGQVGFLTREKVRTTYAAAFIKAFIPNANDGATPSGEPFRDLHRPPATVDVWRDRIIEKLTHPPLPPHPAPPSEDYIAGVLNDPEARDDLIAALLRAASKRACMASPDTFGAVLLAECRARGLEITFKGMP